MEKINSTLNIPQECLADKQRTKYSCKIDRLSNQTVFYWYIILQFNFGTKFYPNSKPKMIFFSLLTLQWAEFVFNGN